MKNVSENTAMKPLFEKKAAFSTILIFLFLFIIPLHLSAIDYYWVGGSGNWSEHSMHWATTSGGSVFHNQVPTSMDNVYFDANSFPAGGTVTIDQTIVYCMDMDWTGALGTPVFIGLSDKMVFIFGSTFLIPNMQWNIMGQVHFLAFELGKTVNLASHVLVQAYFDGTGEWILEGDFTVAGTCGNLSGYCYHRSGTLRTNGYDFNIGCYFESGSDNLSVLDLGSSTVNIGVNATGGTFNMSGSSNAQLLAGTSSIRMVGLGNDFIVPATFIGGGKAYHIVEILNKTMLNGGGATSFYEARFLNDTKVFGDNYYENVTISPGVTWSLSSNTTQTISASGSFIASGDCTDFVFINTIQPGARAYLSKSGGFAISNIIIKDNEVTGGGIFQAGNSVDLGNTQGWVITVPPARTMYWVGGGGGWSEQSHWALSSGGVGENCVPTPSDNVFFDNNSGFGPGNNIVKLNSDMSFCNNITWQVTTGTPPKFSAEQDRIFYVYGSLSFNAFMTSSNDSEIHFMSSNNNNIIDLAGNKLFRVYFDGTGEWILEGDFTVAGTCGNLSGYCYHRSGTLRTNGYDFNIGCYFESGSDNLSVLDLGSSTVNIGVNATGGTFNMSGSSNAQLLAGTSSIKMVGLGNDFIVPATFIGGGKAYHIVEILNKTLFYGGGTTSFYEAKFLNDTKVFGDNGFFILMINPGIGLTVGSNSTQTISSFGNFIAEGTSSFPIEIKSSQLGTQATIHKDGAPICLDYLYLTDMAATGTGLSYVGANSDDVFNNSGWIFEACPACVSAPLPAPVLDPASVTTVMPGEMATLILQNLLPGYEAVWFDSLQTTEVYAGTGNLFQPVINGPSTFYGAFREIATGCISGVLAVFPSTYTGTLISGKILFENDDVTGVNNVTVNLTGAAASTALTNVNGDYSMTVNTTGSFTLKGVKQINRLNGVTVGDVSRIQQHVIGNFPITDPYKLIAADINGNEQVSSQDVTLLQQAILNNPGALAVFSTFWRFIDASVSLNLPPWSQIPAAEQINLMGASGNQSGKNFTGIKVGDVASPSANPANRPTVISPLIWTLQDQDLVAGHVTATFQVAQFQGLAAYQFALAFDPTRLKFEGWQAGAALPLNAGNFGFTETESGIIRTAFAQAEGSTLTDGSSVFTLTFDVLQSGGKLSEALGIDTYWMPAVAYTSDLQPQVVVMNFEGTSTGINNPAAANEGLQLFQNQPNPFTNETLISFRLPEAGEARLRIFDVSGRLLAESVCDCADGYHEERFDLASGATGVMSYELTTPFGVITKKMVRTP